MCEQYNYCIYLCVEERVTDRDGPKFTFLKQTMTNKLTLVFDFCLGTVYYSKVAAWAQKHKNKSKREIHDWMERNQNWENKMNKKRQKDRGEGARCVERGKDAGQAEVRRESLLSSWMVLCRIQSIKPSPPLIISLSCSLLWNMTHHKDYKTSSTDQHLRHIWFSHKHAHKHIGKENVMCT